MHITLFVPGPLGTVSGGYVYDRHVVDGMRAIGHEVVIAELAGRYPLADAEAVASARAAWAALPAESIPVIDGLGLPAFESIADGLAARGAVGLIHHPTALETGHSDAVREALRGLECRLMPRLRRVIVTSTDTASRLTSGFGVAPERVAVVIPGTEDASRSTGSGGPSCAILSIATLIPRKGFDVLLRGLARLPDLDWSLTVVGGADRDPAHARSLGTLSASLGIADRVTFAGELTGSALEAAWRRADMFALATYYEGYGMVIAEALKRGLPVAVTNGGAAGALVTPETGVASAPGDHVSLSNAMRRLIFDAGLRRAMAEAAWHLGCTLPDWGRQATAFASAVATG